MKLASTTTNLSTKTRQATFHAFNVITLGNLSHDQSANAIWATLTNPSVYTNGTSVLTGQHLTSGFQVEIREFKHTDDYAVGCIAKCREDSPPLRKSNGVEVLRPLQQGDTLLEKNYFLYNKKERVLIWHFNMSGNGYSAFSNMLNILSGGKDTFICAPLVNREDMDFDKVEIEYVDFSISMPQGKRVQRQLIDENPTKWGGLNPFRLMSDMDTQRFSGKFVAKRTKSFGEKAINFFTGLSEQKTIRKLKVKIADCDEPIDVLASRFKATRLINYHQEGQHLDPASMFTALETVWGAYQQHAEART